MNNIAILLVILVFSGLILGDVYGSLSTDKGEYSWTDKVKIRLMTHGYDPNRDTIDISISKHELKSYKLSKIGNGLYAGEIILTGFLHDVDGDGKTDTNPRTMGSGSNNGFLETIRDEKLKITLEFRDGTKMSTIAKIIWNMGKLEFNMPKYSPDYSPILRVQDPDMNLNPETLNKVPLHVFSDSDKAGILVDAIETEEDSGLFETQVFFTSDGSSNGNRLFFENGDAIYAKYTDYTLPSPSDIQDSLDIIVESTVIKNLPATNTTMSSYVESVKWNKSNFAVSDTGIVEIIDLNRGKNDASIDTFVVDVWSDSDKDGINLLMKETGENTNNFVGEITFTLTDESSGHRLRVFHGDEITVKYNLGEATVHSTLDDNRELQIKSIINELPTSPIKQQKSGILPQDVECKYDLEKIFRHDGSAVCVKPLTAEKLIQLGFKE